MLPTFSLLDPLPEGEDQCGGGDVIGDVDVETPAARGFFFDVRFVAYRYVA